MLILTGEQTEAQNEETDHLNLQVSFQVSKETMSELFPTTLQIPGLENKTHTHTHVYLKVKLHR